MRPCGVREAARIVHKAPWYCNLDRRFCPAAAWHASAVAAQQRHELAARDLARAEAGQVRAGHLAVDDADVARATLLDEAGQRHFRCIALPAEHRLAKEHPPQLDAVQAPDH